MGDMTRLVIATRNSHKTREIRAMLGGSIQILSLNDYPEAPETAEDAGSFAGNATKKAVELARYLVARPHLKPWSPSLVLADDSGLEVDALNGAPGVYSARFAALEKGEGTPPHASGNTSDADNNARLLRLMEGVSSGKRTARFRCVLALTEFLLEPQKVSSPVCFADELEWRTELFEGVCEGRLDISPRGTAGFGYDPLFIPAGYRQTFAELDPETKNRISHRAKALKKLKDRLLKQVQS